MSNAVFERWKMLHFWVETISVSCHYTLPSVCSLTLHVLFFILATKFIVLEQPSGMLKIAVSVTSSLTEKCVIFVSVLVGHIFNADRKAAVLGKCECKTVRSCYIHINNY